MQKIDKKIASVDHKIEIISPLKIDLISQIFYVILMILNL